jgi:hypothetical protein
MKNTFKVLSAFVMVALIAFSFVSCGDPEDPGNDDVQKSLVITGIPVSALPTGSSATTADVKGKKITIALCNKKGAVTGNGNGKGDFELYALQQITIPTTSNGTIEVALISATTNNQFTGTGKYYILLWFDTPGTPSNMDDDIAYGYTGQVGGSIAVTYNITDAETTIPFAQFAILQ